MKISTKKMGATALALMTMLSVTACSGSSTSGLTKVTVNEVTHSVFYAPQYAAMNLGFFEDEGLEIELSVGQGADKVMAAVLSGGVDIGFAGPEASIYVYNEGRENHSQVFATVTRRDGSFLVGRNPSDNFDWQELRGSHLLPGRKGGVPYMALEYAVKKHGMTPGVDVEFDDSIQFSLMAGAFTAGTGDYVTLFEPTASMVEAEGKGYILAAVGDEAGEIPYTAYFASKSYLAEHAETAQKFVNAVYRGQQWVATHTPREIAEVIAPSFPDTDLGILEKSVQRYQDIDAWNTDPSMTEESYNLLQTVMIEAGELKETAPYDQIVNNSFAEKAVETVK